MASENQKPAGCKRAANVPPSIFALAPYGRSTHLEMGTINLRAQGIGFDEYTTADAARLSGLRDETEQLESRLMPSWAASYTPEPEAGTTPESAVLPRESYAPPSDFGANLQGYMPAGLMFVGGYRLGL